MARLVNLPAYRNGPCRIGIRMERPRFRMSGDMIRAINAAALSSGLTAPAWLRQVVADRLAMSDPADIQPVQSYGGAGPHAAALTALRMQLHELGGLLIQLAKVSRLDGKAEHHADAEHTLAEIRQAIAQVAVWQTMQTHPREQVERAR